VFTLNAVGPLVDLVFRRPVRTHSVASSPLSRRSALVAGACIGT